MQVKAEAIVKLDGPALRSILEAGESWLAAHLKIVNSLNVFPVPDGDTGTNMVLTMRAALSEATAVSSGAAADVLAAIA
ncbi:MAG: DAK2 domain-containing protein, partial [Anaerolineae bacterium]|nr:DAK2 domain-containing protein [Anaerolineae bacterium]